MMSLSKIFKQYIKGTPEKGIVAMLTLHFCDLTRVVVKEGAFASHKVYITTRTLKHIYDSKPAEEFDSIVRKLYFLVKYPDYIYDEKSGKRGSLCFVKIFQGVKYLCAIEKTDDCNPEDGMKGTNYVVTAFRLRAKKEKYLNNYKLLWSWKGDIPSS
jgi:hypothetical protein